ncbi:MAG: SH3 domain-containing protein [Chloroflexi bacterium]|nr:SH3 domain-containing protein [Chloroflexota bacterium]
MKRKRDRGWLIAIFGILAGFLLGLWAGSQFLPSFSTSDLSDLGEVQQDEYVALVAMGYAETSDLEKAQARLAALDAPNPGFFVAGVTERHANTGGAGIELSALAQLAIDLGVQNSIVQAYLPTATPEPSPTPTPEPPTATALPPTPTPLEPTATPQAPTATATPEEPTPTPEPETPTPLPAPAIVANTGINVRSGPGTAYPVVAALDAGQSADIVGRSQNSAWWQITFADGAEGWVFADIVDAAGNTTAVAVVSDISPPPATNTPVPQPTTPPEPPPSSGPDFRLIEHRLWNVEENGGFLAGTSVNCGEKHELYVVVVDAAGNPLNGVTVGSLYNSEEAVTGSKAPGTVEFVLFPPGNGVRVKRDVDGRDVSSDSVEAPTDPRKISYDQLIGARFCTNDASCATFSAIPGCFGHYSWTAKYQRSY